MRDLLYPDHEPTEPNPMRRAQAAMLKPLPKRFYSEVSVQQQEDGLHAITLDGRLARTPAKRLLGLSRKSAAEQLAAEWQSQTDVIDPARMPLTRLVNVAIDHVAERLREVADDVAQYAASDLVCYRARDPEGLVARQMRAWTPVLDWAGTRLGVRMRLAEGIMPVPQDEQALRTIRQHIARHEAPVELACLHVMTTISGSCLIALMIADEALAPDHAFAAATVDEQWSQETWGEDEEAAARLVARRIDFLAACGLFRAMKA